MRRDYPDHDHPKLLEHVADQPANTAATAVRKSPAGSGAAFSDEFCELTRNSRNVVARLPLSFAVVVSKSAHQGNSGVGN